MGPDLRCDLLPETGNLDLSLDLADYLAKMILPMGEMIRQTTSIHSTHNLYFRLDEFYIKIYTYKFRHKFYNR